SADRDAPPPDRAVLDRLRDQSTSAFQAATPNSPGKRLMFTSPIRWIAASVAATIVLGIVVPAWIAQTKKPEEKPEKPEDKFVISDTVDDGRIGKVTDAQGVVSIKPVLHERWSPVLGRLILKPGDWLQTDSRGANAVALRLLKATKVIVG